MNLGRELAPPVIIGRPRFREYPGPAAGAILALPFAALAYFGFTTFRGALSPGFYWFMAVCAALMVLLSVVTTFLRLRFGITIALHELGVVMNGHAIPYADIEALTIRDKRRFDEKATVRWVTRTITIEAAGRKAKAHFVAPPAEALDPLLDTLAARVAAQSRSSAGKGWRIEHGTFHARGTQVPLSTIAGAGVFEREVRLWRDRDEEHFFAVPYESKNARVLLALISLLPNAGRQSPVPSALGRLLFARRTSAASVFGNTIMAIFLLALAWVGMERYLHFSTELALGIAFGGFVVWIFYSMYRVTVRYRFHERALVRSSILGTRTLSYANVATMKWSETATTVEGAIPMGTTVKAKLVPEGDSSALSVTLHRFRGDDADLGAVRNAIASHIAEKLRARFERGEEIAWTSGAKFTRAGLALKKHFVPYDEPVGIAFRDGFLMFFRGESRQPFALLSASDENFYPGLMLFESAADPRASAHQSA